MTRPGRLRARMDDIIRATPDPTEIPYYDGHLYGVATCAMLLARRRGLDAEIAHAMGMLHDISSAANGYSADHGMLGAEMARALLGGMGDYSMEEMDIICDAIAHHSEKKQAHGPYAELLKDADTLFPWLEEGRPLDGLPSGRSGRMARIAAELGLDIR